MIAKSIKKEEMLCYEDLGTEAVRRYTVEDFPCIVAIDSKGNNVYETEPKNIIPKREIKDCKTAVLFIFAFYQKLW